MSPNLAGLHDIESSTIAPPDTWIIDTVALSDNPLPTPYPSSLHHITRLNWAYGSGGTLPLPSVYDAFAALVAKYVNGSSGCRRWIIGNEPSLRREWPDGVPIFPWHYVACYKLCRDAIHALPGHAQDEVLIAGSGPWNDECRYEGNPNGDWITYFADCIRLCDGELDGFALHAYTHGYDVSLVTSTARMDAPFYNRYYNFLCYRDYCAAIPSGLRRLPAYITEANGDGPWQAVGLMPAMLGEIDAWNRAGHQPAIHCVTFYRYPRYDHFYIEGRGDVIAEYNGAVALGYQSPAVHPPPTPEPIPPHPEPAPPPLDERAIDPRLIARGVRFEFAEPPPGAWYWRMTDAEWYDEEEADLIGPDHHILGVVVRDGLEAAVVPLRVDWPSGSTTVTSKADDPNAAYNWNYPMSPSLNEFSVFVDDGAPSDKVTGIGMGANGNPNIHTSTWINFEWVQAGGSPTPGPGSIYYVRVLAGANLRSEPVDGAILVAVPYRDAVTVTDEQPAGDGYEWSASRYQDFQGWIRSDLLSVIKPPAIIPEPPPGGLKIIWPVEIGTVTNWFGSREIDYSAWGLESHDGIDIAAPSGTPVRVVADGKVMRVGNEPSGFGLFVHLWHVQFGFHSIFAHLSKQMVSEGQLVSQGQHLGAVGSTGNSSGPHLHFSFRVGSENDYYRVHTGHKWGASDPMAIFAVINGSDPNLLI